ncbi:hypothetical protein D3C75_470820 [compost metagenome]
MVDSFFEADPFMHRLGEIRDRKPENQSYRASGLTLPSPCGIPCIWKVATVPFFILSRKLTHRCIGYLPPFTLILFIQLILFSLKDNIMVTEYIKLAC